MTTAAAQHAAAPPVLAATTAPAARSTAPDPASATAFRDRLAVARLAALETLAAIAADLSDPTAARLAATQILKISPLDDEASPTPPPPAPAAPSPRLHDRAASTRPARRTFDPASTARLIHELAGLAAASPVATAHPLPTPPAPVHPTPHDRTPAPPSRGSPPPAAAVSSASPPPATPAAGSPPPTPPHLPCTSATPPRTERR